MGLGGHEGGLGLQGFYSSNGIVVLSIVMDGDCGIDVACQMLGLPQTLAQRTALRGEISDHLLARVNTPWMQEVMGALQEVDLDDVRQILHASAGADQDSAVAVADQDTAVAVADQDSAVAVPDLALRRDAIKWATRFTEQSFIANLLDTLPPAVLDEQVRLYQGRSCGPVVPHAPRALVVYPHLLKSRHEAA